jgi:hypothetical protein
MKLVKRENDYCLYNESGETIASSWANVTGKKLSIQNCDEIFGIIDVEKLAYDSSQEYLIKPIESPIFTFGYEQGFNKAIELNKEKLFTLEDIELAMKTMMGQEVFYGKTHEETQQMRFKYITSYLKVLQMKPTEIEVEILCLHTGDPEYTTNTGLPKLDSNGCLILIKL